MWLGDEMRLLYAALLNAATFAGAYLFTRRWSEDTWQRLADTLLIGFAVQYGSVVLPGLLHVLHPWSIAVVAILSAAVLAWIGLRKSNEPPVTRLLPTRHSLALVIDGSILCGCLAAWIVLWAYNPISVTDALTYHVPVAIQWLRDGRLSLLPTWFFNPANTYSPLAGSAFIAWWIAPMHNEVLARFAQVPAMLLVFLAVTQIGRAARAGTWAAARAGMAAALSRPLLGEMVLAKDDVYLAAFFAAAVAGCSVERLRGNSGTARFGIAVGLLLATKYTAVLSLPIFLMLIDVPRAAGWRWRQWGIAIALVLLIAAPWYVRNWVVTGNPVFPLDVTLFGHRIWAGLLTVEPSEGLRTGRGIFRVLTSGYFSVPVPLAGLLLAGWIGSVVTVIAMGRPAWRNPLLRVCVFGPILGLAIFIFKSPYPEVRFIFPALLLLFVSFVIAMEALGSVAGRRVTLVGISALWLVSAYTTHEYKPYVATMAETGAVAAIIGGGLWWLVNRYRGLYLQQLRQALAGLVVLGSLGLAAGVYVYWRSYVSAYREVVTPSDSAQSGFWDLPMDDGDTQYAAARAWQFVRRELPQDATIAYANTHLIYPLLGFEFTHRVLYVPARGDVDDLQHLPHLPHPVSGEEITAAVTEILNSNGDRETWLRRLRASKAEYLFVEKGGERSNPPEIGFARENRKAFVPVFEDKSVVVYQIVWEENGASPAVSAPGL